VHVAVERSLQREFHRAEVELKAKDAVTGNTSRELDESKRFSSLKGVPSFLK
jgi:hypothetical protein